MDPKGLLRNSSSYVAQTDRQTAGEMKDEGESSWREGGREGGVGRSGSDWQEGRFQLKDISTPYHPIPVTIHK